MDGWDERWGRIEKSTTNGTNNKNNAANSAVKQKYKNRDVQRFRTECWWCTLDQGYVHMSTSVWHPELVSFYFYSSFSHQCKKKTNVLCQLFSISSGLLKTLLCTILPETTEYLVHFERRRWGTMSCFMNLFSFFSLQLLRWCILI